MVTELTRRTARVSKIGVWEWSPGLARSRRRGQADTRPAARLLRAGRGRVGTTRWRLLRTCITSAHLCRGVAIGGAAGLHGIAVLDAGARAVPALAAKAPDRSRSR